MMRPMSKKIKKLRTHQQNKLVGCDGYVRKTVGEQSLALGGAHIKKYIESSHSNIWGQWATNINSNRRCYLKMVVFDY